MSLKSRARRVLRRKLWWVKSAQEELERQKFRRQLRKSDLPKFSTDSPNVILFSVDSLAARHLHCYGYDRPTAAHMDELASSGVQFRQAITQATWTKPALASIHTGLYPSVHKADSAGEAGDRVDVKSANILDPRFRTMAQEFKEGGYATAGFTDGCYAHSFFGFGRGFDLYDNYAGSVKSCLARLLRWVLGGSGDPFFGYIHCWDCHFPYPERPPYDKLFVAHRSNFVLDGSTRFGINDGSRRLTVLENEFLRGIYDGCIRRVDDELGIFLNDLKQLGLLENTILLITGDHGEAFLEHEIIEHTECIYNEVLQVPLILSGPGLNLGKQIDAQVRSIDIMPTLLDLCGLKHTSDINGVSLLPWIKGHRKDHLTAVTETERRGGQRALLDGRYKLIQKKGEGRQELYDLLEDPQETKDLNASLPELRGRMEAAFGSWEWQTEKLHDQYWSDQAGPERQEMNPEVVQRLKDFGYLE